jgi:peptidoglycan hydrolase-like protein with peptidoglycan-binding domain
MTALSPPVRRMIRVGALTVVAVASIGAATAAAVGVGGADQPTTGDQPLNVTTVQVTRRTLIDVDTVDGTVAFGSAAPVTSQSSGTVTWLPAVGTVVSRGETLLRADDQPIVLMYGALPMYRQLTTGVKGEDVRQFKQNLKALGYRGFTVDADFTASTATAVKRWQKALKRTETGSVEVADVIYAAGQLRVAKQSVRIGAKAAADVLSVTTTKRVVALEIAAGQQRLAKVHNAVTVLLPDGKEVTGEVVSVGVDADPGGGDGGPGGGSQPVAGGGGAQTIPAVVDIADQGALGSLDAATVKVRYVAQTHPDVLTVPVQALLALAEGGYGLEVRDGADRRVVTVKVGLFSGGQVEVGGDGIAEGTTVGVAG